MCNNFMILRFNVEDFLYREAELLDTWQLNEWLALFDPQAYYRIPSTDLPEGDPDSDLMIVDDDIVRLRARVARLNSDHGHAEQPRSRIHHFINNVRLAAIDDVLLNAADFPSKSQENAMLSASAGLIVFRSRREREVFYIGRSRYRLKLVDRDWKIVEKTVVLDQESLAAQGSISMIL